MSAQQLGARALRRIEADVGEPILRGWSHGGYVFGFVTPDHRHGLWSKKTREWEWESDNERQMHYSSCYETWPELRNQERMRQLQIRHTELQKVREVRRT